MNFNMNYNPSYFNRSPSVTYYDNSEEDNSAVYNFFINMFPQPNQESSSYPSYPTNQSFNSKDPFECFIENILQSALQGQGQNSYGNPLQGQGQSPYGNPYGNPLQGQGQNPFGNPFGDSSQNDFYPRPQLPMNEMMAYMQNFMQSFIQTFIQEMMSSNLFGENIFGKNPFYDKPKGKPSYKPGTKPEEKSLTLDRLLNELAHQSVRDPYNPKGKNDLWDKRFLMDEYNQYSGDLSKGHHKSFKEYDTNKDGKISSDEFTKMLQGNLDPLNRRIDNLKGKYDVKIDEPYYYSDKNKVYNKDEMYDIISQLLVSREITFQDKDNLKKLLMKIDNIDSSDGFTREEYILFRNYANKLAK